MTSRPVSLLAFVFMACSACATIALAFMER